MRVRRSKRIVADSIACISNRMSRSTTESLTDFLWTADEHAKAERIFSNRKNIAFRPNLQGGR